MEIEKERWFKERDRDAENQNLSLCCNCIGGDQGRRERKQEEVYKEGRKEAVGV